jgi:hypothetical protein
MFKYINKLLEDSKLTIYNYLNNNTETNNKYPKLLDLYNEDIDNKEIRINIFLFVRQYKNTYYKYINKDTFNEELYDLFVNDENFDDVITAYDDEDNIRIFDKYILEYIKNRDNIMTYLQSKNKIINLKNNLEVFNDIIFSNDTIDVLFVLDMSEKDLFSYCYNLLHNHGKISYIKDILFSIIFKYDNQLIRLKVDSLKTIQALIHI